MDSKIIREARELRDLFMYVTEADEFKEATLLMDKDGNLYGIDGYDAIINPYEKFIKIIKEDVLENHYKKILEYANAVRHPFTYKYLIFPKTALENHVNVIFIPHEDLNLENRIALAEEIFHAVDSTTIPSVKETLATLGRYIEYLILENEGYNVDKVAGAIGSSVYKIRDGTIKKCVAIPTDANGKIRAMEKVYYNRLWFVGFLEKLNEKELSLEDVLEECKKIYQRVKRSNNPIETIKQIGLEYKTVPHENILKMLNNTQVDEHTYILIVLKDR